MKLKNKKTGEIVTAETYRCCGSGSIELVFAEENQPPCEYSSLAELCDEWEDYKAPKENWIIEPMNEDYIDDGKYNSPDELERYEELGLIFNTKEEAEKALEKLKAWKRVKDNGLRINRWLHTPDMKLTTGSFIKIEGYIPTVMKNMKDLDLLFGGKK